MNHPHRFSRLFIWFLVVTVVITTASLSMHAQSNDLVTVTVVQGVDAESGDPADQAATPSKNLGFLMFDHLVRRNGDMSIGPGLATDWHLVDDVTWEFNLRRDVIFHDGSPMTADDVVFSFTRLLDENNRFRQRAYVSMIKEAVKVDDYTVRIITHEPYAPLLARLLHAAIVPKAYVERVGDEEFSRRPIGTGSFKFVDWIRDDRIVLERFDGHWRGPALPDRVILRTIPEASTRLAALMTGEADIIVNLPPDLIPELERSPEVTLVPVHSVRVMFVGMNVFSPPLDDVRVRQALNYAVNKEELIEWLLGGMAYPHGVLYGRQIHGWDDAYEGYPYDPEKAKRLLAEAGYPNGIDLEFEAPRGRYLMDAELAEAIASQLEAVGVRTRLTVSEWGTFWPKTVSGQQRHLWFLGLGNDLLDADHYLQLYLSSKGRGYFHTPEMDERIFRQQGIMDPALRLEELKGITRELIHLAPWIFLWDQADLYARRSDIVGWEPRADEHIDLHTTTRAK